MKKSIYNTFIVMESQEQYDRMKQLCIDNGLPYWVESLGFIYNVLHGNQFYYTELGIGGHFVILYNSEHTTQATEQEFIELLKQHIMELDDYIEGTFDSRNPANIEVRLDELEEQKQENFKLRMRIQDLEIGISECIEILEQTELTLVLNKLKKL